MYDFTAKLGNMRSEEQFTVYPFNATDTTRMIQSDRRIALVDIKAGRMMLSKGRANGSYGRDLTIERGAVALDAPDALVKYLSSLDPTGRIVQVTGRGCGKSAPAVQVVRI